MTHSWDVADSPFGIDAIELHEAVAQRLPRTKADAAFEAFLAQAAHGGWLIPHPQLNGLHIPILTFEAYLRERKPRPAHLSRRR